MALISTSPFYNHAEHWHPTELMVPENRGQCELLTHEPLGIGRRIFKTHQRPRRLWMDGVE